MPLLATAAPAVSLVPVSHSIAAPYAWLLLLACLVVQVAASARGARTAIAVASALALGYALLAIRDASSDAPLGIAAAALAFLVVSGAIVLAARHTAALRTAADVDEATNCLNRRGFARQLAALINEAAHRGHEVALVALDLDHFKQVNDRFGHLTGDEVLHEVGALLLNTVGNAGRVARMGGEEFAALLPRLDAEAAGVVAERILAELREREFAAMPPDARLTMSAGIAVERVATAEQGAALRARADEALYAAKRSGRNRALLWPPGVPSNSTPAGSHEGVGNTRRRSSGGFRARRNSQE